jgi:peptidoglycan/xylan/chitin deacetylase (PgdA/CDA1 family)
MRNMDGHRRRQKSASWLGAALLLAVSSAQVQAGDCPRKDVLGTSRVMTVDAATYPRIGLADFAETLPLADREVVLTFDDGPALPMDDDILAALGEQCVRATFFMVGRPASGMPEVVRKIAAAGHTVGHHTWSHKNLARISPQSAAHEIDIGIAAIEMALHGVATTVPSTPFFRYPFFDMTQATLDDLQKRGIVVFSADLLADDWDPMTPQQQLKLLTDRLEAKKKGIILLHDPRTQTVAMLGDFLRYLRDNSYRVVHVVPAAQASPAKEQAGASSGTRPN